MHLYILEKKKPLNEWHKYYKNIWVKTNKSPQEKYSMKNDTAVENMVKFQVIVIYETNVYKCYRE